MGIKFDSSKAPEKINEQELMQYYGYKGKMGSIQLKIRLARSWLLQSLASISPTSDLAILFQRARGVNIGNHVFLGPKVQIDLLYPHLVTIEDYVSIGMFCMIFAHSNPTCSMYIKQNYYPRKVSPVKIRRGSWVPPGTIILSGVTIGENTIVGAGSVVTNDTLPYSIVGGVPAKHIKQLEKSS